MAEKVILVGGFSLKRSPEEQAKLLLSELRSKGIEVEIFDYLKEYRESKGITRIMKLFSRKLFEKVKLAAAEKSCDVVIGWSFGAVVAIFVRAKKYILVAPMWPRVKLKKLTLLERVLTRYHNLNFLLDKFEMQVRKTIKEKKKVIVFLPYKGIDEKIDYKTAMNEMIRIVEVIELPKPGHRAIAHQENIREILHFL